MKILFAAPINFHEITIFVSQYFTGLAKAAKSQGHDVRLIQTTENMYNPILWKIIEKDFQILRYIFRRVIDLPHDFLLMRQIYNEVKLFKPDLVICCFIDSTYIHHVIRRIRVEGTKVFTWLGVHPSEVSNGIIQILRNSDKTLCYDPSYINYYDKSFNIDNISILPLGCDVEYYDSVAPDNDFHDFGVDISFIGLLDNHRKKIIESLKHLNLGVWTWNDNEIDIQKNILKGKAHGKKLIKIFKSSKIVLNIHRNFENNGGNYRLFEIPACHAFQLVDDRKDIGKFFKVGKEVVTFKNNDDLVAKAKYFLENPKERIKIASNGYNRVRKDHTLNNRMRNLIEIYESIS